MVSELKRPPLDVMVLDPVPVRVTAPVPWKVPALVQLPPTEISPDPVTVPLLKAAMQQLHLSARAFHRVLKLARTIADLAGSEVIAANHLAEAVQYRPRVGM